MEAVYLACKYSASPKILTYFFQNYRIIFDKHSSLFKANQEDKKIKSWHTKQMGAEIVCFVRREKIFFITESSWSQLFVKNKGLKNFFLTFTKEYSLKGKGQYD